MMQSKGRHSKIWKLFFYLRRWASCSAIQCYTVPGQLTRQTQSSPVQSGTFSDQDPLVGLAPLSSALSGEKLVTAFVSISTLRTREQRGDLLNWKWSTIFQSSQIIFDLKIIFPVQSHSMDRVTCGVMNSEINFQFWFPNLIWVECFRVLYWFPVSWLLSAVN